MQSKRHNGDDKLLTPYRALLRLGRRRELHLIQTELPPVLGSQFQPDRAGITLESLSFHGFTPHVRVVGLEFCSSVARCNHTPNISGQLQVAKT